MPEEELFSKESIADGRIISYCFASTGSEAAEKWYKEMENLFSKPDQGRLLLIDIRQSNNQLSAEMGKTLREGAAELVITPGKTALLVASQASTKVAEIQVQHNPFENAGRQLKMFSDENEAIAWLLEP
jgi:hypothetical protein